MARPLLVLAFVFASWLAIVPLVIAVISIMTSFLLVWALTAVTSVSALVGFLIALVGLGVAIDYSLLIVARWRGERVHGHDGEEAIVRAMATAGLLALVALPLPFLRSVGYGGMLIPLTSVAVSITLLPIILLKFGTGSTGRTDAPMIGPAAPGPAGRRSSFGGARSPLPLDLLCLRRSSSRPLRSSWVRRPASRTRSAGAGTLSRDWSRSSIRGSGAAFFPRSRSPPTEPTQRSRSDCRQSSGFKARAPVDAARRHGATAVLDVFAHTDSTAVLDRVRSVAHPVRV